MTGCELATQDTGRPPPPAGPATRRSAAPTARTRAEASRRPSSRSTSTGRARAGSQLGLSRQDGGLSLLVAADLAWLAYEPGTKMLDALPREFLFADVPDELASWAAGRLRPQSARVFEEPVTAAAWQTVPTTSIVCSDDVIFPPVFAERLRARGALELPGSHSPFLSRPAELAELISSAG
ncbi:alpha/beta fold hydrolase [Lentzea sp. NPDC054927]